MQNSPRAKKMLVLGLCIYALFCLPLAGGENFSLEDIFCFAFPSELTTSPSGKVAAWVSNQEGRRNIWMARGPDFRPVKLTDYSEDDGQELGGLAFNFDGTMLVYVRGGNANRAGEYPNPRSNPNGADQAVWVIPVSGGAERRLGEGRNPVPSPVDNRVIYAYQAGLRLSDMAQITDPRPLFKARGNNHSPVWSPDGTRVAFVSEREDHAYIGIHTIKNEIIHWVAPSVDRDGYPVWSPDGKRIAFFRVPAWSGASYRTGIQFWLMVGDAVELTAEKVWECPTRTGGFAQSYPSNPLRWGADDSLVFYSEHEKWMHLYAFSLPDRRLFCLTPGEFEVEDSDLSKDGRLLVFNSNAGDIDRRHIWKVSVPGGTPEPLTVGEGLEWAPRLTSDGKQCLMLCSTAVRPACPAVLEEPRSIRILDPWALPERFPSDRLVLPGKVTFKSGDGLEIHGQLFVPASARTGDGRPAVIFMHGGPMRQMMLGWHMRGYYHNAYGMNQYLAGKGYVVLSVNYRSGIGYGYDFRNAPRQGPRGASEYQDIVAAGRWLQRRPEVDPDRIGLWGGSYGGYLTAMGLARDSQLFSAGVDLHGVHDWSLRGRRRNGGGWEISGENLMSEAFQSSPVADIESWFSPALFIHGDDDRNVDFIQTTDLVARLRKLGRAPIEVLVFPDEVHGFLRHDVWMTVYQRASEFFDRYLAKRTP